MPQIEPEDVLNFWLGTLDHDGRADAAHTAQWFKKDPSVDASITNRFGNTYQAIVADQREHWLETARGRLAYVIVLDQFSRNMFRGSAEMYKADAQALHVVKIGLSSGDTRRLCTDECMFLYMPLMHSESIEDQDACVALFQRLHDECDGEARNALARTVNYAIAHRDIVARFGRFPHRNTILGRKSTEAEEAFLKEPNSGF